MKSPEKISQKIKDFSHTEFNSSKFNEIKMIELKIKKLKDPYDRKYFLIRVEIDEYYPEYILKNQERYSHLILNN